MSKKFPADLANRGAVKITDKLLIHNIDTGVTEYTTVAALLTALALNGDVTINGEIWKGNTDGYMAGVSDGTNNGVYWNSVTGALSLFVNSGSGGLTIDDNGNLVMGAALANAHAAVDVKSTTKAFLIPRMTDAQMQAIATPEEGMMVFNLTEHEFYFYDNNSLWVAVNQ